MDSNNLCAMCGDLRVCAAAWKVGSAAMDGGILRAGIGTAARGAELVWWLVAELGASAVGLVAIDLQQHRNASKTGFVNPRFCAERTLPQSDLGRPSTSPPIHRSPEAREESATRLSRMEKYEHFVLFDHPTRAPILHSLDIAAWECLNSNTFHRQLAHSKYTLPRSSTRPVTWESSTKR